MDPPAPHRRLSLPGKMTNTSRSPPCIFFYFVGIVGVCIITQMIHHFHVATKFSKEMIPEPMAGGPPVDHGANHDHLQHQQQQHQKKTKRLNVIIFYPDDWTHHDLGGVVPVLKTPFLSQLAREGIRFTHNAVTTSICWISRATLFTGQYVSKHASTHLFRPYFSKKGGAWERSWPALLQSAGYYTGLVGKWQYQSPHPKLFDFQRMYHGPHWWPKGDDSGEVEHTCEKTQRDAIDFLNERPLDKPFALTVSLGPPKGKCESCRMHLSMNIVLLYCTLTCCCLGGTSLNDTYPSYYSQYEHAFFPEPYNHTHAYSLLPWFLQDESSEARKRWQYRWAGKFQQSMKVGADFCH